MGALQRLVVLAGLVVVGPSLTSCSSEDLPASDHPTPTPTAATAPTTPSAPSAPPPASTPARPPAPDERVHPFTYVDVRAVPVTVVSGPVSIGPPPRIHWVEPDGRVEIVHRDESAVRAPRGADLAGTLGESVVLTGDGVQVLASDGTITTLDVRDPAGGFPQLVDTPSGRAIAWRAYSAGQFFAYRYAEGDPAPTAVHDDEVAAELGVPGVVGIIGSRDVLVEYRHRRKVWRQRSSGRPARWGATYLEVVAPGLLLGSPSFTPPREVCRALYSVDTTAPQWTRCYRWGHRPVDGFYSTAASPDGRWLITMALNDVLVVDAQSGSPVRRIRFTDRVQDVAFEDDGHFLMSHSAPEPIDGWPAQWIVRCSLDLVCERATPGIVIRAYDSLLLMPPGRGDPY